MKKFTVLVAVLCCLVAFQTNNQVLYRNNTGSIKFTSDAPLEIIKAESNALRGIIDTASNKFAFSVNINTFHGFNGPLQEEHFNENYMESDKYPVATFSGKLIENIDYSVNTINYVRAKGELTIHGVKQERLIKATLEIKGNDIIISSKFNITLNDHNIKIPRIVHQKIAPDINVEVNGILKKVTEQ